MSQQAPPMYSEHQFDLLYSDLDTMAPSTPAGFSGIGTPFSERNSSSDNLPGLQPSITPNPSTLHTRLSNLRINGSAPSTPPFEAQEDQQRSFAMSTNPHSGINPDNHDSSTPESSGRPSEEGPISSGIATPNPHFREVEDLSRVPSYTTAVRSTARTQLDGALPDYREVMASDLSRQQPVQPAPAHVRSPRFVRGESPIRPPFNMRNRGPSYGELDSERGLRIMQARGG